MLTLYDLHAQLDEAIAVNSVESSFSYELYTDLINGQRSLWLRNEYNKNRSVDPNVIQTLRCLELELVNPIDCCITVPTGCKVLRTTRQIPNTIEFYFTKGIVSVGPANIMKPRYVLVDYSRIPYVGHGRTTQNAIYTFLYDGYLYVISRNQSHKLLQYLTVRGLFEDPTMLGDFIDCNNETCWSPAEPYPINMWMWEYIKPIIVQQLLQKGMYAMDDSNNADDQRSEPATQKQTNGGGE